MDKEQLITLLKDVVISLIKLIVEGITKKKKKQGEDAKCLREMALVEREAEGVSVSTEIVRPVSEEAKAEIAEAVSNHKVKSPIEKVAWDLEVDVRLIQAFIQVESGRYHKVNGRLVINYESHYFKRFTGQYVADKNIIKGDKLNQEDEWRNFEAAKAKNEEFAYRSISMGKTQIMGSHYKTLGYGSAKEMFQAFDESEDNAILAFGSFVKANKKLWKAVKEKDYHHMAYYYNGSEYKKYVDSKGRTYADKIQEAYRNLCA